MHGQWLIKLGQSINHKLTQSSDEGVWNLYLATDSYDVAPKKRTDNRINEGTTAPVRTFPLTSPFAGNSIEEAAEWLKAAPEDVDLDRHFFAVLDAHSETNDTITIARIGDGAVEGKEGDVQYFPVKAEEAVMYLNSMASTAFDERLQSYQRERSRNGETDLSKGEPYNGPKVSG